MRIRDTGGGKETYKNSRLTGGGNGRNLYLWKNQGKTLVITAGVHGCEYVGIEAAKRMAEFLEPMELAGNVILIPLVNRCGFLTAESRWFRRMKKFKQGFPWKIEWNDF